MFTRKKTQTASTMTDNGEIPEVAQHSYVLAKDPFAVGGFSNVYYAKKKSKTSLITKGWYKVKTLKPTSVTHGEFVIKVCETNAERLKDLKSKAITAIFADENQSSDILRKPEFCVQVSPANEVILEITIMKSLQPSKYVVKLHEAFIFTPKSQIFIVMEKLAVNLSEVCELGLFKNREAERRCILNQVVDGLCYLKEKEVIHRDIKPSNILLSFTGYVKLCDFGIATINEPFIVVEEVLGSREFMAPEMFIIGQKIDYAVDVWAFAMLVVATYRKGKTLLKDGYAFHHWGSWAKSSAYYYHIFLGYSYVSQAERMNLLTDIYTKGGYEIGGPDWNLAIRKDPEYNQKYEENYARVELLRKCFIPLPKHGPDGNIDRPDLDDIDRLTIEAVKQMQFYKEYDRISELQVRNSINKIVSEYHNVKMIKNVNSDITL